MRLKELDYLELPASADMHVHLRQGEMMDLVTRQLRRGGIDIAYVMVGKQGHSLCASYTY
jgi:dihydroorotase